MQLRAESVGVDLHVRGQIPAEACGTLIVPASRRNKDRRVFSRWHDSQADLIRLDVFPGKPGRVTARILAADSLSIGFDVRDEPGHGSRFANFVNQPNHAVNVAAGSVWATNLLFGVPLEVDLVSWQPTRLLRVVEPTPRAPGSSTTAHFAFSFDKRYAYFHQSLLTQEVGQTPVEVADLRLVELDTSTGAMRSWPLVPPRDDSRLESANFHSAFYFEENGHRFVGLLRTGAVLESLLAHKKPSEHRVVRSPLSEIWIVELEPRDEKLHATLLPGIREIGGIALSHLSVDAQGGDGFILFANCKQADVAEETHGMNVYDEAPEAVSEHYSGMIVEPFNVGVVLRYERKAGRTSIRTFKQTYDPGRTSLGHSWLPINIELDATKKHLFCSFNGFRPRLLPKHIASAYGTDAVDPGTVRYIPPLLMRLDAATLEPEFDRDRTYLSYAEPMPTAFCGTGEKGFVCTFSPELGLRIYRSDNLRVMVCHAVSAELEHWQDSHFRPEPAHMQFIAS